MSDFGRYEDYKPMDPGRLADATSGYSHDEDCFERKLFTDEDQNFRGNLLPEQEAIWKRIQVLEKKPMTAEEFDHELYDIQTDYYRFQERAKAEIEERQAEDEAKYIKSRNSADILLEVKRAETLYSMTSDDDLEKDVERFKNNPDDFKPEIIEVLLYELVKRDLKCKADLRTYMEFHAYATPWKRKNSPMEVLKRFLSAPYGTMNISTKVGVHEAVDISKIIKRFK